MANCFLITDDHPLHSKALGCYLEKELEDKCIGCFTNIKSTLDYLTQCGKDEIPQYAIIDINLGKEDGLELIKTIHKNYRSIGIICYSMYTTPGYVSKAKAAGSRGYVSKTAAESELIKCIKTVVMGGYYIEDILQQNLEIYTDMMMSLTKREVEIAELVLQNYNNKQIAEKLFLSRNSVANYISSIYEKVLGVVDNTNEEDKRQKLIEILNSVENK